MSDKLCLYRHFDADGRLLYVGTTLNILARSADHRSSHWFPHIARIEVEHVAPDDVRRAEREAICAGLPLHNLTRAGTGRKKRYHENLLARFPAGTISRIDAARHPGEERTAFIREAVEREIKRREKK